jgi:hypothetical protein
MTLMKSLLLGSAATLMVVAGAQAADLPTKKGAPAAQYVKICNIGGIAGFIIPGTDTCLKISGLVTAQTTFGSTANQYNIVGPAAVGTFPFDPIKSISRSPSSSATTYTLGTTGAITKFAPNQLAVSTYGDTRNQFGMFTRAQIKMDAVSNTAYGPLLAHITMEQNDGAGFDSSNSFELDGAYIQWAGITAGYHASFFTFIEGGYAWDDLLSSKFDPTNQLAYTATFGGGFSATLSLEVPEAFGGQTAITESTAANVYGPTYAGTVLGTQSPDIVAALDVTQGWGSAHLGGLLHQVRQSADAYAPGVSVENDWGWGVLGGVSFNFPSLGAGADIKLQAQYTDGAIGYTHLFGIGAFNLSGVTYDGATSDAYYNSVTDTWTKPTAWGAAFQIDLPLGPTFKIVPEGSYGEIRLSTSNAAAGYVSGVSDGYFSSLSRQVDLFVGGATFEWTPVKNLVFDLDLLYADGHQDAPTGWGYYVNRSGTLIHDTTATSTWKTNFDGFNGKLRIERDF